MNILRVTSTTSTGGLANPILATLELAIAVFLSVLAVTVPLVAGALVLGLLVFAIQKLWVFLTQKVWRVFFNRQPQPGSSDGSVQ
jgi:flagellar biosynthesis protein FlhB